MGMPSGDTPEKAHKFYHYLQGHQETMQRAATWHVRWIDLAWLWGFVIALSLAVLLWVWQYRTTRQKIYPVDSFGGYTTELAGPATFFFILLTVILTGWAVALIVGHHRLRAEVLMAVEQRSLVLPYVSWATATFATIPAAEWELVYGSLQALKAHVQEYPGCQKLEAFIALEDNGDVNLHCYSVWDTPEQLEAFLERGYTVERMLADVAETSSERTRVMEKVF